MAMPVLAAGNSSGEYFYGQLSPQAKDVYDVLNANREKLRRNEEIVMVRTMTEADANQYLEEINAAALAFDQEHPEVFWLRNSWHSQWVGSGLEYTFTIRYDGFDDGWGSGGRSVTDDETFLYDKVLELAKEAQNSGDTQYAQLLYLHDWLTAHNLYNSAAFNVGKERLGDDTPWEAISALDDDLSPVCEGYSKAFKLFCDQLGFPCVIVEGGEHAWNYVLMDDGKWYGVDVTYDDPIYTVDGVEQNSVVSGGEIHDYFLIGSRKLFQDHTEDDAWDYPVLSEEDYDPGTAIRLDGTTELVPLWILYSTPEEEANTDPGLPETVLPAPETGENADPELPGTVVPVPGEDTDPDPRPVETFRPTREENKDEKEDREFPVFLIPILVILGLIGLVVAVIVSRRRVAEWRLRRRDGGLL